MFSRAANQRDVSGIKHFDIIIFKSCDSYLRVTELTCNDLKALEETKILINYYIYIVQYVALNPDSPWSGHLRFIVHFSDRKQSFNKTEPFQRFLDLFAVLTSLEGFPAGGEIVNFKST